jgi:phosphoribosyl 1,2-cyclic phosphodiesterase
LGLSLSTVKAIFVSHEHSDHITGIPALSKKYQLPVYITAPTFAASGLPIEASLLRHFTAHTPVCLGDLAIVPFPKHHDAADPHSFIVRDQQTTIGIFTDIGHACETVIHYFAQCHGAFLEANYCETMLANGRYPYFLQQRISGDDGHLSNNQALELFTQYRHPQLQQLVLAHLSKNNNSVALVEQLFREKANGVATLVASRYAPTPLLHITADGAAPIAHIPGGQLSLFAPDAE